MQQYIGPVCLSVKTTILIHWKWEKMDCFNLEHWIKDYLELLSVEQAASALMNNRFSDTWTSIRSSLHIFHVS